MVFLNGREFVVLAHIRVGRQIEHDALIDVRLGRLTLDLPLTPYLHGRMVPTFYLLWSDNQLNWVL